MGPDPSNRYAESMRQAHCLTLAAMLRGATCAVIALAVAGCQGRYATFQANPDRDLTGLSKAPLMPAELRLLQRVAEVREAWQVDLPANSVLEATAREAAACFAGRNDKSTMAPVAGGFISVSSSVVQEIVVERWQEHDATVVGLQRTLINGFGAENRGFLVMFAIQPIDASRSRVYAYRREDTREQQALMRAGLNWVRGEVSCP